jgi:peptidoglycan/xylan/chitin deacetylase (PgdA/CDA1 family)
MTSKKHHRNRCALHPEKRAHAACTTCGKWLCNECMLVVRGVCYCLAPDCRPDELKPVVQETAAEDVAAMHTEPDRSLRTLIFRSSVTIALCGVVFAVWALREVWKLHTENSVLRSSRLTLIEQLKNSNREIGSRSLITPAEQTADAQPSLPPSLPRITDRITASRSTPPQGDNAAPDFPYNISNGPIDQKSVALTFDGSSLSNAAVAILDTLSSRSVTATMFLTGEFIRKFPAITRRIVAAGHECGNHTWGHPHLTSFEADRTQSTLPAINEALLHEQLRRAEELFRATTGTSFLPLWRAPYGEFNRRICNWAYDAGYLHIGWRQGRTWREGSDSNDWIADPETPGYHTPAEFFDKIMSLARQQPSGINGGILLLHLGTERDGAATQVHLILGTLIDSLRSEGYRIVPVSEMVASAGIDLASLRERIHIQ